MDQCTIKCLQDFLEFSSQNSPEGLSGATQNHGWQELLEMDQTHDLSTIMATFERMCKYAVKFIDKNVHLLSFKNISAISYSFCFLFCRNYNELSTCSRECPWMKKSNDFLKTSFAGLNFMCNEKHSGTVKFFCFMLKIKKTSFKSLSSTFPV